MQGTRPIQAHTYRSDTTARSAPAQLPHEVGAVLEDHRDLTGIETSREEAAAKPLVVVVPTVEGGGDEDGVELKRLAVGQRGRVVGLAARVVPASWTKVNASRTTRDAYGR